MSFEDYLKVKIFLPLNMKYSTVSDSEFLLNKNKTEGYFNPFIKKCHIKNSIIGAGAIYSNINEMIRYVQFHLNQGKIDGNQLIDKKYLYEMYKINRNFYGLGLWITRPNNNEKLKTFCISHSGGGFGYASHMVWFPEFNLGCVILGNKMIMSDDYSKISENLIIEYILNNDEVYKNRKQNVGFIPVFKEDEKNKSIPQFLYPAKMENRNDTLKYNILGKYEQALDLNYAKWFAKIVLSLHIFKPMKLSITMNNNVPVMNGVFGQGELKEYIPGLYFINTGEGYEAFDIRHGVATFRNIKLRKYSDK
jgi:hypothetical protein